MKDVYSLFGARAGTQHARSKHSFAKQKPLYYLFCCIIGSEGPFAKQIKGPMHGSAQKGQVKRLGDHPAGMPRT